MWRLRGDETIMIFYWRWQCGAARGVIEYDEAWSADDTPVTAGYVRFEATGEQPARDLKLQPLAHRPVVERLEYLTVDDLPAELREDVKVTVPGYYHAFDDGPVKYHAITSEDTTLRGEELVIGQQPIAWVRAAVVRRRSTAEI
jgi:hypothetical protein